MRSPSFFVVRSCLSELIENEQNPESFRILSGFCSSGVDLSAVCCSPVTLCFEQWCRIFSFLYKSFQFRND